MSNLPKGWKEEKLVKFLCSVPTGVPYYDGEKAYYSTGSVNNGTTVPQGFFSYTNKPSRANRIVFTGDLLQAKMKSTNKALLVDKSLSGSLVSTGFLQIRIPESKYDAKLAYYYLKSDCFLVQRDNFATGSTQEALTDKGLKEITIPVPPIEEQKRIVERLVLLLSKINKANERLEKIPTILNRFRKSVLSYACSGRLTANWRENKKCTEWKDMSINELCSNIVDCPHSTPKWTNSGKICIRTTNFKVGRLDLSEVRYVSEKTFIERTSRLVPMAHDILYSREGGILGIACQVPNNVELCLGQRMMLLRTKEHISSKYVMNVLNSPLITDIVREKTGGTASPHLNVGDVKNFVIPTPTFQEQEEIVHRVDKLFALAEKIEQRYKNAKAQLARAEKAIYAKAFRGELVPQEDEFEM